MLHAAGVSDATGAVASLVAASGTGKTTAAMTLCQAGFGYVTDETVAISRDGAVMPFARPLGRVPEGGGPKVETGPDELGLAYCPTPLQLGAVLLLERSAQVIETEVKELSLLEGVAGIVEHTSALSLMSEPLAWAAENLERAGGVYHVRYGEAAELVPVVEAALAAKPLDSGWVHHAPRDAPGGRVEPGMIARTDYVDAVAIDEQVLLLIGSRCFLLEGVAGVLWQALEREIPRSDVTRTIVGLVGGHPDAQMLTTQAVETLRSIGAITGG